MMLEYLYLFLALGVMWLVIEFWVWMLAKIGLPLACYSKEK